MIKTDPIARQVRLIAGATSLLMIGVALLYLALSPGAIEHKLPPAALLLAALLVAGIAFSPIWDRWPRDAFLLVVVLQAVVLGLFLFSIGRYHPWHAYWMLVMVLAGARLGRRALAIAALATVVAALSPFWYGGTLGSTLSSVLNYWVEIPGYLVAALVTHLLFSGLRRSQEETAAMASEARKRAAETEERNVQLEALYNAAEKLAPAVDPMEVQAAALRSVQALVGLGNGECSVVIARPDDDGGKAEQTLAALKVLAPIGEVQMGRQEIVVTDVVVVDRLREALGFEECQQIVAFPLLDGEIWLGAICVGFGSEGIDGSARQALTTFSGLLRGTLLAIRLRHEVAEKAAVQRAGDLKAEFVSAVSHELRTPISTIQGFSELLMTCSGLSDKAQSYNRHVFDAALHMGTLVNDLHELSLLEAGRMTMDPGPQDLGALVDDLLAGLAGFSPIHSLQAVGLSNLPAVYGDSGRIRQVLANLVQNAIKYSPNGGLVEVSARQIGEAVEISVKDEGIGVPVDELDRIFQRFYRGSGEARTARGTGLGLNISQQIVEAHGGRIWVTSVPGAGSTFLFTLPLAREPVLIG